MRHTPVLSALALACACTVALPAHAGTFTYRGTLSDRGKPAAGAYGLRLGFYGAESGGKALSAPVTLDGVPVRDGAFNTTVELPPGLEARDRLWLEVEVRDAEGTFVPLGRRESVQPKALAAGVCWDVDGNSGTLPISNILGTTDGAALRIQAGGGVGVNTFAPQASLHVRSGATFLSNATPDPGTVINAEKATGNAFISIMGSAQRGLIFGEPNSIADGGIFYDNANSSALDFRTASNTVRMRLGVADMDGNGTTGAEVFQELLGKNGEQIYLSPNSSDGVTGLDIGFTGFTRSARINIFGATVSGNLTVGLDAFKPGGGSWSASSDRRLKKNIAPLEGALDRLLALRGVTFEYEHPDTGMHPPGVRTGFVAQEVQQVFPDWVAPGQDGYLTVGTQGFEALAVEALRTLKQSQEDAIARNEGLDRENAELRDRLERLERLVEERTSARD